MNLKERGITVGDLLLILIVVISTVLIINKFKKSEKKAYLQNVSNGTLNFKKVQIIDQKETQFLYRC